MCLVTRMPAYLYATYVPQEITIFSIVQGSISCKLVTQYFPLLVKYHTFLRLYALMSYWKFNKIRFRSIYKLSILPVANLFINNSN